MIYIFVIFILLFFIYIYDIGKFFKGKRYTLFFIWLSFAIIAGLSYRVGIDAIRYAENFVRQPNIFELAKFDFADSREDPLWVVFSSIFRTISDNFIFLHLSHALIVNGVILYFISKYASLPFTALLIYFLTCYLFFNFEILRESLAVSVYLFAYKPLTKKNWVKYYLITLIAFFIHSSASIAFFIPFLLTITRIKSWMPIVIVGVTFIVLGSYINEIVLEILPSLNLNDRVFYKLTTYLGRDEIGISIGFLLKNVVLPVILLAIDKYILHQSSKFAPITKLFLIIGVISMIIPVVDRLLNYLIVIYIIHISETLHKVANRFELRILKFMVINLLIFCFSFASVSWLFTIDDRVSEYNYNRYFPYSFYIFGEKEEVREKFHKGGS
jgi:hypothetical protein